MARPTPCVLLLCLGACAAPASRSDWIVREPSLTSSLPVAPAPAVEVATRDDDLAPKDTTLPIGIGMTFGPSAPMLGATLDFPLDKQITFGPSLQYAFEDDLSLLSVTGQLKYYFQLEEGRPKLQPYGTFGAGLASIDKDGISGDEGLVVNVGGGLRLLTGDHYSLGSELRWNWLPDDLGREDSYFSWEIVHVVISF
jgi:hypothetical protein